MSDPRPAPLSALEGFPEQEQASTVPGKTSGLRRVGCGLAVILWFMLLLMPCVLFYLAANGEIRIWHDAVPDPHAHPRLLLSLLSEKEDRGLRIEASSVFNPDADDLSTCVQTDVRFLLWESQGGNQDVTYCECYQRSNADAVWALSRTYANNCTIAG